MIVFDSISYCDSSSLGILMHLFHLFCYVARKCKSKRSETENGKVKKYTKWKRHETAICNFLLLLLIILKFNEIN